MRHKIPKNVLTDTCFWIAFFDKTDEKHQTSVSIMEQIERTTIILPWPILYEVLRTKFVKNKLWVANFNRLLTQLKIEYIYDDDYRQNALWDFFGLSLKDKRNISFVDVVLRSMLKNINLRIDYLITYNERDFIDICKLRKVPIYYLQN